MSINLIVINFTEGTNRDDARWTASKVALRCGSPVQFQLDGVTVNLAPNDAKRLLTKEGFKTRRDELISTIQKHHDIIARLNAEIADEDEFQKTFLHQ